MEKRTLLILAALVVTVMVATVLFRFVTSRSYPVQCPAGTCSANWGQDDVAKGGFSKEKDPFLPAVTTLPSL